MRSAPPASYRITVDTGGTFTDVVIVDDDGRMTYSKAPTVKRRVSRGIREALEVSALDLGVELSDLLGRTSLLVYATTHATNAILEHGTARTAFFTTEGFPDILVLREGGKRDAVDFRSDYPDPYVPRGLTYEIPGRIDAQGDEVRPLDAEAVRSALRSAKDAGVEAIAVSLIWSIANGEHERAVGRLIEEECPGLPYTLSHQLNPIVREYRRASSTAIDASLKPLMQGHFRDFQGDLLALGFGGELLVVTSMGGCLRVEDIVSRPIHAVSSGPAMAPVAARAYAKTEAGDVNVVVCDAGGTSFDVSLIQAGAIKTTRETWLGSRFQGHITGLSSVEVTSIGSGGGSIAWVDGGGLLRVGPASAGADPGPACYRRGGTRATVTDAAVVLGYFDPGYFLGGRLTLDLAAAHQAVTCDVAEPLGVTPESAALGVLRVAGQAMVSAIRAITVNQGVDPRECALVAGGGAGGLSAVDIARELGCASVLVPPTAATLSAAGAQFADIVSEFAESTLIETSDFDFDRASAVLDRLEGRMRAFEQQLIRDDGRTVSGTSLEFSVEARYPYQVWELEVPLPSRRLEDHGKVEALVDAFHAAHQGTFRVAEPTRHIECQTWKGRVVAELSKPRPGALLTDRGHLRRARSRNVWFDPDGPLETRCLPASELVPGAVVDGPAILEESTTTIVIPPGARATVTPLRGFLIDLEVAP